MKPHRNKGILTAILLGVPLMAVSEAGAKKAPVQKPPPLIRFIDVESKNVFDPAVPGEDRWPFTWADVIHFTTRREVILRSLLVKPGDPADPALLSESERTLRALPFIKDATVRTVPTGDGRVDVLVQTQDTWTTQLQVDYGTAGDQSYYAFGLLEENLLGYGKTVSMFSSHDNDGASQNVGYTDPQLGGTRGQLSTLFVNDPGGNEQHINLAHPFYSLQTDKAAGVAWNHDLGRQKVYENGVQTNEYDDNHHDVDGYVGLRANDDPLHVDRLSLHYRYTYDFFTPEADTLPGTLPLNRTISGPAVEWDLIQSDYIKDTFVDKAQRVEDFNLGHQATVSLGYAPRMLASTDNTVPLTVADFFGFRGGGSWFGLGSLGMTGRYGLDSSHVNPEQLSNTLYSANSNLYTHFPTSFPFTGVAHVESAYVQNIDSQDQLALGGDTGLRGFKVNAFTGNKSVLGNFETRFYYPREVFHLAYFGGACFFETGEVEPPGFAFRTQDLHADVGIGLRIGLTRSTVGTVVRFDLAYAIGQAPQQSNRFVFSIAASPGFKAFGNSSSSFPNAPSPPSADSSIQSSSSP